MLSLLSLLSLLSPPPAPVPAADGVGWAGAPPSPPGRLLGQVRDRRRCWHCSLRTEEACVHWVRAFVRCHSRRHPRSLGQAQVGALLTGLPVVRCGKGGKGRVVRLPAARARKQPRAELSRAWFRVLPQADVSVCPRTGVVRRHHLLGQSFQRAFKRAVDQAGLPRPATPHALRRWLATRRQAA